MNNSKLKRIFGNDSNEAFLRIWFFGGIIWFALKNWVFQSEVPEATVIFWFIVSHILFAMLERRELVKLIEEKHDRIIQFLDMYSTLTDGPTNQTVWYNVMRKEKADEAQRAERKRAAEASEIESEDFFARLDREQREREAWRNEYANFTQNLKDALLIARLAEFEEQVGSEKAQEILSPEIIEILKQSNEISKSDDQTNDDTGKLS